MISSRPLILATLGLWVMQAGTLGAQQVAADSPFMPSGSDPHAVAPGGTHELVGMIATNSQTLVGITDTSTRKSVWIPVGKTVDGIEVVSCDPQTDRAVVRVGGETKTLSLRSSSVKTGTATPPPPPPVATVTPAAKPAPVNPTVAEQEREARMLVSDLLEISMQQRKAYEEAQRKAAQNNGGAGAAAAAAR